MYLHNRASKILNENNYTIPAKKSTTTSTEVKAEKPEVKPEIKPKKVDLVDEHYYKDPQWFLNNAKRYGTYDRKGPKVS